MTGHPWRYRVEWREPGSPVIPHPGHAMFRELSHAFAHVAYLAKRGIVGRTLEVSTGSASGKQEGLSPATDVALRRDVGPHRQAPGPKDAHE